MYVIVRKVNKSYIVMSGVIATKSGAETMLTVLRLKGDPESYSIKATSGKKK